MRRTRWSDLSTAWAAGAGGSELVGGADGGLARGVHTSPLVGGRSPAQAELTINRFIEIIVGHAGCWRQGEAAGISRRPRAADHCGSLCWNDGKDAL